MKHTSTTTEFEPGDPHHISFMIRFCPVCGKALIGEGIKENYVTGRHVHLPFAHVERALVVTCDNHKVEAGEVLTRQSRNRDHGYIGEWEPKLGLAAEVLIAGAHPAKVVTIL